MKHLSSPRALALAAALAVAPILALAALTALAKTCMEPYSGPTVNASAQVTDYASHRL